MSASGVQNQSLPVLRFEPIRPLSAQSQPTAAQAAFATASRPQLAKEEASVYESRLVRSNNANEDVDASAPEPLQDISKPVIRAPQLPQEPFSASLPLGQSLRILPVLASRDNAEFQKQVAKLLGDSEDAGISERRYDSPGSLDIVDPRLSLLKKAIEAQTGINIEVPSISQANAKAALESLKSGEGLLSVAQDGSALVDLHV